MNLMKKIFSSTLIIFLVSVFSSAVYADSFKIQEIEVIEADIIEIQFTRELDTSLTAIREFILEEESSAQEIEILLSEVVPEDATKVTLMLGDFLSENTDYTITVLDIKDIDGNTIEAWIDSVFTFNTGTMSIWDTIVQDISTTLAEETQEEMELLLPEEDEDIVWEENIPELNAAAEFEDTTSLWGTTLQNDDMQNWVLTQAENNEALPDTWAEIFLIIILTLFLAGWYMYSQKLRV